MARTGSSFDALSAQLESQDQWREFLSRSSEISDRSPKGGFQLVDWRVLDPKLSSRTQMSFRTIIPVSVGRLLGQMAFPSQFSETPRYFRELEDPPLPAWVRVFQAFGVFFVLWMLYAWSLAFRGGGNGDLVATVIS